METKVNAGPSECRSLCPKVCLTYKAFKNIVIDESSQISDGETESENSPPMEILFQGQEQCSSSLFDPNNLSEFEHEKLVKLFKQKAIIAYLISVGCTTHQSLKDMTQYVLENEEPPPFKPKCVDKHLKSKDLGKHRHKHHHRHRKIKANLEALGSQAESDTITENLETNDGAPKKRVFFSPQEVRNDEIHIESITKDKIQRKLSIKGGAASFYGFSKDTIEPKKFVRRNLREPKPKTIKVVKKEELRTKSLLPPLNDESRRKYNEKVVNYFQVKIDPKNLQTAKQRQEYREKCRKSDADWRKYINKWGLYFPYSGFLHLRHKAIKELENSHLAPGMYHPDEYEEIQKQKKLQMQKGFDNKLPRFIEADEFGPLTPNPLTYGDGVYKYENYMRNKGNIRNSNFLTAERFSYKNTNSNPSAASYDFPSSVDTLLKSQKGAYYPKGGFPHHKRRPRDYINSGYYATQKDIQPRPSNVPDFLRTAQTYEDHTSLKPLPSMLSELNHPYNQFKGKMKKLKPKIRKPPVETPGPGYYDIAKKPPVRISNDEKQRIQERAKLKKYFKPKEDMANVDYEAKEDFRILADNVNSENIGPGAYNIAGSLTKLSGFKGRFKEGPPQIMSHEYFKILGERLRGKDIPLEEKLAKADL